MACWQRACLDFLGDTLLILFVDGYSQMPFRLLPIPDRISNVIATFNDGNAAVVAPRDHPRRHHLSYFALP
jgi:hypothetical protein